MSSSSSNVSTGLSINLSTGDVQSGHTQFRNRIINGDMRINQRGTSTTLASMTAVGTTFGYVADRWGVFRAGYATGAQMGQGTNLSTSDQPFIDTGTKTYARVSRISGNTGTADIFLVYGLESQDSQAFVNKYVTLSFYCRAGANFSGTSLTSRIITGTGTDEGYQRGANVTGIATYTQTNNISTNWSYVSQTALLGTNINQVGVYISYTPTGTAGANDYFDITCIQLEKGTQATSFEVRPYALELQLCQRYFQIINISLAALADNASSILSSSYNYLVPIRTNPTPNITAINFSQPTIFDILGVSSWVTLTNTYFVVRSTNSASRSGMGLMGISGNVSGEL